MNSTSEPRSASPPSFIVAPDIGSVLEPSSCNIESACHDHLVAQDGNLRNAPSSDTSPARHGIRNRRISHFHARSWHNSFGSQDFGFCSALHEPTDVATADELFYNGQLLPLQSNTRLHLLQTMASLTLTEDEDLSRTHVGRVPAVSREDEVKFTSCRIEGSVSSDTKVAMASNMQRSSSFRSQNSGYSWESGADKDTGESSSSDRDSNGSSQDSCTANSSINGTFPTVINSKLKLGFNSWISIFNGGLRKGCKRQQNPPQALHRVAFSEDLSRYRSNMDPSVKEAELVHSFSLLTVEKESEQKSKVTINHHKAREYGSKEKSAVGDGHHINGGVKGPSSNGDGSRGTRIPAKEIDKKKETKQRWQGYGRKIKPLIEMKKRLMGQFKLDNCGKNACDQVKSGTIRRPRPSWQRRLSHQASFFRKHKQMSMNEEEMDGSDSDAGKSFMAAMSSCPPSTLSSPNHSGLLALVVDTMSTMQESHNAVQSAIAHCKESNKQQHSCD